jgi:hypothetical protein
MIRPLRKRHRRIVSVLAIFLSLAFAVGIAARRPVPVDAAWRPALTGAPGGSLVKEWVPAGLFAKSPVQVRLLRLPGEPGQFAFELSAAKDFLKPDLLVYWAAGNPGVAGILPDHAILLGAFSSRALPLPDEVARARGVLVLYSLADNEVVDVSNPVSLTNPTK